jgi:hypothetical protein
LAWLNDLIGALTITWSTVLPWAAWLDGQALIDMERSAKRDFHFVEHQLPITEIGHGVQLVVAKLAPVTLSF